MASGNRLQRLLGQGPRFLFSAARRGQPGLAGLGAAMTIVSWMRRRKRGDQLIYKRTLKKDETIKIRLLRGNVVVDDADAEG